MKKILFIMILATSLIPIPQTGASTGDRNISYKAKEMQADADQKSVNISKGESLTPEIIKPEAKIKNASRSKNGLKKKRISDEKRARLFGLLLLAHGGQR